MEKVGIIVNPHAKKNQKMKNKIVELYKGIGGSYVDLRVTNNLDEVLTVSKDFKKQGITYLGICGGDGTLHHVLSSFIQVYKPNDIPPVVILKAGTMNNVSKSINLNGRGSQVLTRLIRALNDGRDIKIIKRDTIKIENKYCFLFGLGLASNFLCEYYKGGNTGPLKATKVLVRGVWGGLFGQEAGGLFERLNTRTIIDGKELWFNDFFGILAGTVKDIGISFKPLSCAYKKDGTFHLIASGMKPLDLVFKLNKFRTGKALNILSILMVL